MHKTLWKITKTGPGLHEVLEFEGNMLLNAGIARLLDKGIGEAGDAYTNGNSYIGVGDSSTAAAAAQTGLQAASNKAWAAMNSTYPSRADQTITFQSTFASGEANFAWAELSVGLANDDSGANLNRKVQAMGTKTVGTAWTVDCAITLS